MGTTTLPFNCIYVILIPVYKCHICLLIEIDSALILAFVRPAYCMHTYLFLLSISSDGMFAALASVPAYTVTASSELTSRAPVLNLWHMSAAGVLNPSSTWLSDSSSHARFRVFLNVVHFLAKPIVAPTGTENSKVKLHTDTHSFIRQHENDIDKDFE